MAVARLAGYDSQSARVLPATALLLRISLDWHSGAHTGLVERTMVVAARIGTSGAPAPSASPT